MTKVISLEVDYSTRQLKLSDGLGSIADCALPYGKTYPVRYPATKAEILQKWLNSWGGVVEPVDVPPKGWGNEGCALGEEALLEWCVLDAQWFGLAQRRKRVFVVADFGNWQARQPLFLECNSLRGDIAPRGKAQQTIAGCLTRNSFAGGAGGKAEGAAANHFVIDRAAFNAGINAAYTPIIEESETMATLVSRGPHAVAYSLQGAGQTSQGSNGKGWNEEVSFTLNQFDNHAVAFNCEARPDELKLSDKAILTCSQRAATLNDNQVRRLTPRECERLQGFPDDYTLIPIKKCSDTARYKALGNSMAVPVMNYIGNQIERAMLIS